MHLTLQIFNNGRLHHKDFPPPQRQQPIVVESLANEVSPCLGVQAFSLGEVCVIRMVNSPLRTQPACIVLERC